MIYPLNKHGCETQPLITVANITLRNITSHGGLLPPGIIRCNETNPCTGINFENVHVSGWWSFFKLNFIVEQATGSVVNSVPIPALNGESQMTDPLSTLYEFVETALHMWFNMALSNYYQARRFLMTSDQIQSLYIVPSYIY